MKTQTLNQETFDTTVNTARTPVLVDFWADWCGPCKMLAPVLDEVAAEQAGKAVVAKVNVDESPELASRFHIQSIPTLLYFRDGQLRDQSLGVVSKKVITNKLTALAAANTETHTV